MNLYDKIQATAAFIQSRIKSIPTVGIILGSGLGDLTHAIETETEIDYEGVPYFPVSTVKGHSGKLLFGKMSALLCQFLAVFLVHILMETMEWMDGISKIYC